MSEITRTGKWNPGGGRWLEVVAAVGVASYLRPTPSTTPVITLRDGFAWTRIYCTEQTLQYRQSCDHTDNGPLYSFDIKGESLDDTPQKASGIDTLFAFEKFLVRFTDCDGLVRIAGSPTQALTFSYDLDTGKTVTDGRSYSLAFKGTSTLRSAYV